MDKKLSNPTQQLFIGIGVIVGVCIANYKNITITGLLIGFGILGILAFFFIHTKVGRKIDKGATKAAYDRAFKKN